MASRLAHRLLGIATLIVMLFVCGPAFAQNGTPSKQTAAKVLRLVKDANDEFDRGEFGDALELYQEAYDLYPDAVLLYRIGLSAENTGDKRRAVAAYSAFVDAAKSDDATAQTVKGRIAELQASIPPLVKITSNPAGADVFVNDLDGRSLGQTPGSFEIPTGDVEVLIRLNGYRLEKRKLSLNNGEEDAIDVELQELERLANSDPDPHSGGSEGGLGLGGWGWITTGVGVALLGTGATFAVLAVSATDDVNSYDKQAPGASREELNSLKNRANKMHSTSVGMFVAGGVVTAVGVSLIVVDALSSKDEHAARITPGLGVDQHGAWVGLSGRF